MKITTFNINNVNKRLSNLLDWLRGARPDVACSTGTKDARFRISDRGNRKGRLRRCLAGAKIVERHWPYWVAIVSPLSHAPRCPVTLRHAEPVHRGGRKRCADRDTLCAQRQPAAGAEIQNTNSPDEARSNGASEPSPAADCTVSSPGARSLAKPDSRLERSLRYRDRPPLGWRSSGCTHDQQLPRVHRTMLCPATVRWIRACSASTRIPSPIGRSRLATIDAGVPMSRRFG